jgi:hypothetical protein
MKKKTTKKLDLSKTTLRPLVADKLTAVVGGAMGSNPCGSEGYTCFMC